MEMKENFPLSQVYRLIEPGPVVLLTTNDNERLNIMTMSWLTMLDFEPPIIGCVVSNENYTFHILKETKECVINIPSVNLAKKVVGCGNTSGREIDKFNTWHLTPVPASCVHAPLIDECFTNLECQVIDMTLVDKYNFFILEVIKAWAIPSPQNQPTIHHQGMGQFMVAGKTITLASKMK